MYPFLSYVSNIAGKNCIHKVSFPPDSDVEKLKAGFAQRLTRVQFNKIYLRCKVTITQIVPTKLTKFNTVRENLEPDIDPATGEFGHELETLEADNDAPHELP